MSDDAVPLREHLEGLIKAQRDYFDATITALAKRYDEARAGDKMALDAAFASAGKAVDAALTSADKAVRTALEGQKAEALRSDDATEKRMIGLNELRRDVAMTADVKAVKDTAAAELKSVRDTVAVELSALIDKVGDLKTRADKESARDEGRAGGLKDHIGWIVAAVTVISALVGWALLLRK